MNKSSLINLESPVGDTLIYLVAGEVHSFLAGFSVFYWRKTIRRLLKRISKEGRV